MPDAGPPVPALTAAGVTGYRGRFAPSPTGPLHFGSLVAALGSWLLARHHRGTWLVRIEDLDPPREIAGAARQQVQTLRAFGMTSDEPVVRQSERGALYATALARLLAQGDAFACTCSRAALTTAGGIHHRCIDAGGGTTTAARMPAIRVHAPATAIGFDDALQGHFQQCIASQVGDYVARRADGLWAYQLAVVVDDAAQRISHVVRGADLLDSTPRQIHLQRLLGLPTPHYTHLPLVLDANGRKLGKSLAALPVDGRDPLPALRAAWTFLGQDARVIGAAGNAGHALRRASDAFDPRRMRARNAPSAPPREAGSTPERPRHPPEKHD